MSAAMAILTDTTRCIGCERCVQACKRTNALEPDAPRPWKQRIDDLSSTRYTTVLRRPGGHNVRLQCRHCLEPACVSACLVGAMQKSDEGPVTYDKDLCMGCRYCMIACPYGIPRYEWESAIPIVRKCDMCAARLREGKRPACVEACAEGASIFGDRDELLREAHRRLAADPGKYVNMVVGETEIGGTSVLYLSDIRLDFLGFQPELGDQPLPERTWAAISKVPPLMIGMGGLMTAVWWFVGRRVRVAKETAEEQGR